MNIKKALGPANIAMELPGNTKEEIIENLLDIAMETGKVKDREKALESLLDRENRMSTGMQNGIAIPHGKTDAVDELVACLGFKREGMDFKSLDKKPAKIFIMTLSPLNKTGPHLQFIAAISNLLKSPKNREAMLEAETKDRVLEILFQ